MVMSTLNSKKIEKSIEIARGITTINYRYNHIALLWKKNRLISIGQNNPFKESAKALYFGVRFNVEKFRKYPFLHAEIDAIRKIWGKMHLDSSYELISLRVNTKGKLDNAKPCGSCSQIIEALGLKVMFSNKQGQIIC